MNDETLSGVATAAERAGRRPLGKRRFQSRDAAALLVDTDPERPLLRQPGDLARQLGDLLRLDDVAGEVDDAAEIELGDEPAQIRGHGVTLEADDRDAPDVPPDFPKRHAPPL